MPMKLFVATTFLFFVLILSVITWRGPGVQMELAKLEGEARAILANPDHLGVFDGLKVETIQLDVILSGTADHEVRDRAIKLLHYGEGNRIPGLRAGVIVDRVRLENPEPPELHVEARDLLLSFSGRIPEGDFREQLVAVAKEFPVTPTLSSLRTSRDVGGAEWFGEVPGFVRKFLSGAESASLILSADRLILDRMVADDRAREQLIAAARALVPAGVTVDVSGVRVAPGLQMRREADAWTVSGVMPDEDSLAFVRRTLEEADPSSAGKNDYSKLSLRPGMTPPVWLRRLSGFLPAFAAGVRSGAELTVTGNEVVLRGDIVDPAATPQLLSAAQTVFASPMVVVSKLLNASNTLRKLSFDFGKSASARIAVTGGIPNAGVSESLAGALQQAFPGRAVDLSGLRVESSAQHEEWVDKPLARFLEEFGRRTQGTGFLRLDIREASLSGVVPNEIARDALGIYLTFALGSSFSVNNLLTVEPKAKVPAPYAMAQVFFEQGSALISPPEKAKIVPFGERLVQGGDGVILVKGFASKSGTVAANLAISAKRADAVRMELVRLGVAEDRMQVLPTGKPGSGGRGEAGDRRVELVILD
jgi:outer membrane protein OmpA-like peptidoglycan-associated protein